MFRSQATLENPRSDRREASTMVEPPARDAEARARKAFLELSQNVTEHTARSAPLPTWAVTRVAGDRYSILAGVAEDGSTLPQTTLSWADSVCSRMVAGYGPRIVEDVLDVPAYAASPLAQAMGIRGYGAAPIQGPAGELLGVLCGGSLFALNEIQGQEMRRWESVLESQAELLGVQLARQMENMRVGRSQDLELSLRSRDSSTHLPDRLGWGLLLRNEEERARELAESMGVIVVRMHNVRSLRGMRRAAHVITELIGQNALVARIDSRQFGVLCGGYLVGEVESLARQIEYACYGAGIDVRIGWAMRGEAAAAGAWRVAEHEALLASRLTPSPAA